jgi:glycosyltransferase involved in cell wall biosynthesis
LAPDRKEWTIDPDAPGKIVVFGTMNAMPPAYAIALRHLGQDAHAFIDVPQTDTLSRPEYHFPEIHYPYPAWLTEIILPSQLLASFFPRLTLRAMLRRAGISRRDIKAVVLSGQFIRFAPLFGRNLKKYFLSYGSDLDIWCSVPNAPKLAEGMLGLSVFRFLPAASVRRLIPRIVGRNLAAAKTVDAVIYFPKGTSATGDEVLAVLEAAGVKHVPRYDLSFDQFFGVSRGPKVPGDKLVIVSPTRFIFKTFSEGAENYSKGNDRIIRGLALFRKICPELEIHFFEKGEDVAEAKRLCAELGLEDAVTWHGQVPFRELIGFYERADLCIDAIGDHLVGAAGLYGMYMHRPLVANARKLTDFYGDNPILHAETAEDVRDGLTRLIDPNYRRALGQRSAEFVERTMGLERVINQIVAPSTSAAASVASHGNNGTDR